MGDIGQNATSILAGCCGPWTEAAIIDALERIAAVYGFRWFALHTMPSTDEGGSGLKVIACNWPAGFEKAYERTGLARFTPLIRALRADPMPLPWDVDTFYGGDEDDPSPGARLLLEHGFRAGVFLPVHGLTAFNGCLSFAGEEEVLTPAAINELHLAAFAVFGMLAMARFEENRRNNPLSLRERDCLKLAMLGKTSSEIGTILSLSEATVSQYLSAATRKVNASNRTHAVALAAQLGYLS
ncbi:LuxR family transcriptional regulator [Mangrovicella endophytica]|uniref:LuxR family transcriptional regulator n=1 Tax=Mangrovicella endophytica TaxID=2066697 RepID=UPI000C9DE350|nr:LuxR family transcriptional regulator [Mangrovicella endophytica]